MKDTSMEDTNKQAQSMFIGSNNKSPASKESCSGTRLWIILTVVFLVISLALAIHLIYLKVSEQRDEKTHDEKINLKFPGFFRTPEEQAEFEKQYIQVSQNETNIAPITNKTDMVTCSFSCPAYPTRRFRRHSQVVRPLTQLATVYSTIHAMTKRAVPQKQSIYNGCCISTSKFISPDTAKDLNGENVIVVRLNNLSQWFLTEDCEHAKDCTGCTCKQETTLTPAVVIPYDSDDDTLVTISFIQIPGCCKCVNVTLK